MHEHQLGSAPPDETRTERQRLAAAVVQAMEQSRPADVPRIWAGSIADYLAGTPHGRWITASRSDEHLADQVNVMLYGAPSAAARGEPSSWGIFAFEGFGRHEPDPDASLAEIVKHAKAAREDSRAFAAWASLDEGNLAHSLRFPDTFQGRYDSLNDWVTLQVESAGYDQLLDRRLPDYLRPFVDINIDALAHDLVASGDVTAVTDPRTDGVWVFANR